MDYSRIFSISAQGMTVERMRVEVAALNLANANTVAGPDGQVFRPMRVVAGPAFGDVVTQGLNGIPAVRVESVQQAPRMVYEPGHPMADGRGYVAYAAVDTATEMMTLMSALRTYESNVAAMNTTRSMALKALEIGRNT